MREWVRLKRIVMINATLRKLKYSELYERLFDQESDKESPTSLYNILLLVAIIGCMAIDTSICERGFSLMKTSSIRPPSEAGWAPTSFACC